MTRPWPPRTPRITGVLAAGLLALGLASSTPCHACSCAESPTVAGSAARADVVFVGTLVDTREPVVRVPGITSSQGPVAKVFEVTEVRKGEVGARAEVLTAASGASCGLEVEEGRTYVVVARSSVEGLRADLCGGTRLLTATTPADLDSVGAPSAPEASALVADLPVVDPTVANLASEPFVWVPAAGLATVLVTLVLMLLRRRRS